MGGKRISQRDGGPRRPSTHSGRRVGYPRGLDPRMAKADQEAQSIRLREALSDAMAAAAAARADAAAARASVTALAGKVQDLQLDLEWALGLRRAGIQPPDDLIKKCL